VLSAEVNAKQHAFVERTSVDRRFGPMTAAKIVPWQQVIVTAIE
jgi:hypothetical protein